MQDNINKRENMEKTFNIKDVFLALRKHIWLILAIIMAFTVVGSIYCFLLKPEYTVVQKLVYRCENKNYVDSNGNEIDANKTTSNINTMYAYGDTIIDFFDEGVVLDRANFYYDEYLKKQAVSAIEAEEYLLELAYKAKGDLKDDTYTPPTSASSRLSHIQKSKISSSGISSGDETLFAFTVSYTAPTREEATEKISVLVNAFVLECKETKKLEGSDRETIKYFGEFEVVVSDLGVDSVSSSVSKIKTLALFVAVGVVVSLVTVLLLKLLDNTVKTKKELEQLVDAPTLALIDKWGD